jgi:hypothetical protein
VSLIQLGRVAPGNNGIRPEIFAAKEFRRQTGIMGRPVST